MADLALLLLQAPEFLKEKADTARVSDLRAAFEGGWQRILSLCQPDCIIVGAWDNLAYWERFRKFHFFISCGKGNTFLANNFCKIVLPKKYQNNSIWK